jgi:acyl-CoA synthetase (AMP-forming)/AMP-acid ligase II
VLAWLDEPREGRGFRFARDGDEWSRWDYPRLARLALATAARIEDLRSAPAGPVSIVARNGPEFIGAFFGALAAGHPPSPLAPPAFGGDRARYVEHATAILRTAQPALVLAEQPFLDVAAEAAAAAGLPSAPAPLDVDADGGRPPSRGPRPETALLQFTSGSTGSPRAVGVSWANLEANLDMIRRWLRIAPDDQTATWLPVYHDMGLIGCFLTPVLSQTDVWMMRPEQFVADPLRWLRCFGERGVQLTAAPNFGFGYALRRVAPEQLAGLDFSAWRAAIVGAERVDPGVLARFAQRLAPHGFRPEALLPAYGLAEATLAVTGAALEDVAAAVRPDWARARMGAPLPVAERATIADSDRLGSGAGWLVACGAPLAGTAVSVLDDDGHELPDGYLGEVAVRGPAVAAAGDGDRLLTGDAGVIVDGELLVAGRLGDSIKVRGRALFAEDLEGRLAGVDGVPRGGCVVLAGVDAAVERVVALVESEPGPWVDRVTEILRTEAGPDARIEVRSGPRGTIERTSSGKPRRRVMWQRLLDDTLAPRG